MPKEVEITTRLDRQTAADLAPFLVSPKWSRAFDSPQWTEPGIIQALDVAIRKKIGREVKPSDVQKFVRLKQTMLFGDICGENFIFGEETFTKQELVDGVADVNWPPTSKDISGMIDREIIFTKYRPWEHALKIIQLTDLVGENAAHQLDAVKKSYPNVSSTVWPNPMEMKQFYEQTAGLYYSQWDKSILLWRLATLTKFGTSRYLKGSELPPILTNEFRYFQDEFSLILSTAGEAGLVRQNQPFSHQGKTLASYNIMSELAGKEDPLNPDNFTPINRDTLKKCILEYKQDGLISEVHTETPDAQLVLLSFNFAGNPNLKGVVVIGPYISPAKFKENCVIVGTGFVVMDQNNAEAELRQFVQSLPKEIGDWWEIGIDTHQSGREKFFSLTFAHRIQADYSPITAVRNVMNRLLDLVKV